MAQKVCEPEKQREGWGRGSVRAKERCSILLVLRAIFVWPSVCFISQWMKRSNHGLFVFRPKKTLIGRRHCSIDQSCCSMTSKRSIDWFLESSRARSFFSPERSLNQPKATRVCIRSINQSNRSISVRLLFYSCVFMPISTSYENRSNRAHCKQASAGRFLTSNISLSPPANRRVSSVDCSCLFFSPVFSSSF